MDIKQLAPGALTELADRIHCAQFLVHFEHGKLIVEPDRPHDEVRNRLNALANDLYSTPD